MVQNSKHSCLLLTPYPIIGRQTVQKWGCFYKAATVSDFGHLDFEIKLSVMLNHVRTGSQFIEFLKI